MSNPRWLDNLKEALSVEKSPTYTLSTVLSTPSGVFPRSRSVIHRGIITPHSPSRPLLLTTTDIRMPKAHQLHHNPNTEATFWFPKSNTQFRIVASAYLLPHPSHPWHASFPADALSGSADVDWNAERLRVFESVSGYLRATFVRPMPGSPLRSYDEGKQWANAVPKPSEAEGGAQERLVKEALDHFVLVVLDPTEIDLLELGPNPNRRTMWFKKGNEWAEQIVVP